MNSLTFSDWQHRAGQLKFDGMAYINGQYVNAQDGATFARHSPVDGRLLAQVAACGETDVDLAVAAARRAYESGVWSGMPPAARKQHLLRFAALIEQHAEQLALIETLDMGKPVRDALQFDVPETARTYAWFAETIDKQYDDIAPTPANVLATLRREPLGVVAAVVPWNYPLLMAAWKLAPALAAGNSVILKPAEQSPLSALWLGQLAEQAGIPEGVFNVVPGHGPVAGRALGLHPGVDCLAFTGSTATGKHFMRYAADSNLKRVWLECGGKSPHIIFADCPDLDRAALVAAQAIFVNQGEVCIAGSRLYVHNSVYEPFMQTLMHHARCMAPLNPLDPAAPMGAIVDQRQMNLILGRIERAQREGAHLVMGGRQVHPQPGGYYVEPTIFECGNPQAELMREEVFGPVLAVQRFDSDEEAIALANDSVYGLGAGIWTASVGRAHKISRQIRAGLVWVNCYADGDVTVPFGGFKQSGFGRDKSLRALEMYQDWKTTWINLEY